MQSPLADSVQVQTQPTHGMYAHSLNLESLHLPFQFNLSTSLQNVAMVQVLWPQGNPLAITLYYLIDSVVARMRVENISMEPTLTPGQYILVNKLSAGLNDIHRGDVIVFRYPLDIKAEYIKRVIGLPGDTIVIQNGKVFVNREAILEPYIAAEPAYNGKWVVPEASLFVLGDNRNQSSDSHSWGFVPWPDIVGKVLVVYWPLDQIKTLSQTISVLPFPYYDGK